MISVLIALAAAAQAPEAGDGKLIGGMFLDAGATEQNPSFSGFGIYLPQEKLKGPVDAAMIRDPAGILGPSGFAKVKSGPGWISFTGKSSLRLTDTGGAIFSAELKSETGWTPAQPGICQIGDFATRDKAFAFFDDLLEQMNQPES